MKSLLAFLIVLCSTLFLVACQSPTRSGLVAGENQKNSNSSQPRFFSSFSPRETQEQLAIRALAFDASKESFMSHPNYLALPTPYPPVKEFMARLEAKIGRRLVSRGEAHVTILTPPEFLIVKDKVSMREIEDLARAHGLALSDKSEVKNPTIHIEPVCVGEGKALIEGIEQRTYYIVVRSQELRDMRRAIHQLFVQRGGNPKAFAYDRYFPHITLGFTKNDLHENQGVIKDETSCLFALQLIQERS
jgi:hypothetical protein